MDMCCMIDIQSFVGGIRNGDDDKGRMTDRGMRRMPS